MKKTLTLSLLVSMALALVGCPDKKSDPPPAASAEPGAGTDKSGTDKSGAPKEDD